MSDTDDHTNDAGITLAAAIIVGHDVEDWLPGKNRAHAVSAAVATARDVAAEVRRTSDAIADLTAREVDVLRVMLSTEHVLRVDNERDLRAEIARISRLCEISEMSLTQVRVARVGDAETIGRLMSKLDAAAAHAQDLRDEVTRLGDLLQRRSDQEPETVTQQAARIFERLDRGAAVLRGGTPGGGKTLTMTLERASQGDRTERTTPCPTCGSTSVERRMPVLVVGSRFTERCADPWHEPRRCPTCDSPSPSTHPAVQHGGEVQLCYDAWHATARNVRRDACLVCETKQGEPCDVARHARPASGRDFVEAPTRCGACGQVHGGASPTPTRRQDVEFMVSGAVSPEPGCESDGGALRTGRPEPGAGS